MQATDDSTNYICTYTYYIKNASFKQCKYLVKYVNYRY